MSIMWLSLFPAVDSPGRASRVCPPQSRRARILVHGLLALLAVHLLGVSSEAQELAVDRCYQVKLPSTRLGWPTSGVWTEDREALLVADSLEGHVVSSTRRGHVEVALKGEVLKSDGLLQSLRGPSQIRAIDGGFLLEDKWANALLRFNPNLQIVESTSVIASEQPGPDKRREYQRQAIYGWTPMGRGILAFGDLEGPEGWTSGFFYFDDKGQQEVFNVFDIGAEVADHYTRSTTSYVAALGGVGYILSMGDETVSIDEVRLGEGTRPLASVPERFQNRPKLDKALRQRLECQGARRATEIFKSYETADMASGIFAWNSSLYLLTKEAMDEQSETTAWWLSRVDLEDGGRELPKVRLPSSAAHLTVVPGDDFWALIEKGRVEGVGEYHAPLMDTSSMVLVPTPWLENPSQGKLLDQGSQRECVSLAP